MLSVHLGEKPREDEDEWLVLTEGFDQIRPGDAQLRRVSKAAGIAFQGSP
jgi:hypothetical protein